MAAKREKPPTLFKKGPSYLFRMQYKDNGVTVRTAWCVGKEPDPLTVAERNAKIVRAMVREGRVSEVDDFLAGRLRESQAAGSSITVNELVRDFLEFEERRKPKAARDAASVYRNHLKRSLGRLDVASISAEYIFHHVLEPMAKKKKARATLRNARIVARKLFSFAKFKKLIESNPVDDLPGLPATTEDHRDFVIPREEEFIRLVEFLYGRPPNENTGGVGALELVTLIIASRNLGGQRTSDLHDWRWSDIDLKDWKTCKVRRPKTEKNDEGKLVHWTELTTHTINDDERIALMRWWEHEGRPCPRPNDKEEHLREPFVFPVRIGKRAGQRKTGTSYAKALRVAMTRALGLEVPEVEQRTRVRKYQDGSTRKMTYETTVWKKVREPVGREVTLLLGDDEFRPLNMHTMRRAYNTALGLAEWSREKRKLAGGWKSDAMVARYDKRRQQEVVDAGGTTPNLRLVHSARRATGS